MTGKQRLHLTVTVSPVDQHDVALLLEFRHIDQQLKIAREERQLEQQQANRELIRNLAHEIKNPLGGIRGAAQLLERELDRPQLNEYTQVIIGEADRLQSLVNRLLTPHRLPNYRRTNVHEILVRVKGVVQAEFPAIPIVADFDTSLPEIEADPEQLTQAVLNIVRNAAQALTGTTNGPAIRLTTRVARYVTLARRRHRLAIAIAVEDNGPGIPSSIRERIFYPLVSGREGGSGLGLTIAQTFVAQHNGMIECESQPGNTVFRILLPFSGQRSLEGRGMNEENGAMYAYDYQPPVGSTAKPIWIVDDDRSIRWVLEKALAREGIPFKTFASAYEVLQALAVVAAAGAGVRHPHAGRVGLDAAEQGQGALAAPAGDRDDRVLRSGQRRRGVPGRRVRISAEAVRRRSRARVDPSRDDADAVGFAGRRRRRSRRPRCSGRRPRCRRCSARSADCRNRTRRC